MARPIPRRRYGLSVHTSTRYALQTPSVRSRAVPTIRSPSQANTTNREASNDRWSSSGVRPLSKRSAARASFSRVQSTFRDSSG